MVDYKLIRILENISFFLELLGEPRFKTQAYQKAAEKIYDEGLDLKQLVETGEISQIKGFGTSLVEIVKEYVETGKVGLYDELTKKIPASVAELKQISGLGNVKIKLLLDKYNISNVNTLEQALENNELKGEKGFTEKFINQLQESITQIKGYRGKTYLHLADEESYSIISACEEIFAGELGNQEVKIATVGQVPRAEEIISEIEILIGLQDIKKYKEFFNKIKSNFIDYSFTVVEQTEEKTTSGVFLLRTIAKTGVPLTIYFVPITQFIISKHSFNCSEEYFLAFKEFLNYSSYNLDKFSIKDAQNNEVKLESEEHLYQKIGFTYVEQGNREVGQTIEFAMRNELPTIFTESDIKGMLHCHSTWSDGKNTLQEMADAVKDLGYEYFGICDHSKTAAYANGLSIERVLAQIDEIDKINENYKNEGSSFRIIKGIESDILPDGLLDYPDEILSKFDFVVASVHSSFKMDLNQMTERVSKALENPYSTILGHPTGRILLERQAYQIDIPEIIQVAAKYQKIMELNASPYRFDLAVEWVTLCKMNNVKIAINTDAHSIKSLSCIKYGVQRAKKSWLERKDVVNSMSSGIFLQYVKNIRKQNLHTYHPLA